MAEEREAATKRIKEIIATYDKDQPLSAALLVEAFLQSSETSAITAGKIIEKAGLIQFDDQ